MQGWNPQELLRTDTPFMRSRLWPGTKSLKILFALKSYRVLANNFVDFIKYQDFNFALDERDFLH